ncbi:MAG: HNH endonuclease [Pseudomonadota bacterium]|nr:HNH endonuclease [Pseudomonadota bacterium]
MDRETWAELGARPTHVRQLAESIEKAIAAGEAYGEDRRVEELEFSEGKMLTRVHLVRERDAGVRAALLRSRHANGGLRCEMCDGKFLNLPHTLREAAFEAHHKLPLSSGDVRSTKLGDMALLCACCHRIIHRLISLERRWFGIEEARDIRLSPQP